MKLLLAIIAGLFCFTGYADNLKLAWDASPSTNVVGYALYSGTNSGNYLTRTEVGTNLTASVEGLVEGRWYFVVTAFTTNNIESLPSNEVNAEVPKPPANMRTVIVQYGATLTNFYDVGFFRLRLP